MNQIPTPQIKIQPHTYALISTITPLCSCIKFCKAMSINIGGCIQKYLNWPPGVRTPNCTALCH